MTILERVQDIFPYLDLFADPYITVNNRKKPAYGYRKGATYYQHIISFDIETSRFPESKDSYMYIWQMCVDCEYVVLGRTWADFRKVLNYMYSNGHVRYVIYIHNLSFEFSYLQSIMQVDKLFASKVRRPIYAISANVEFRCSYYLSNMGLGNWTKNMNVEHQKLDGDEYDYSITRYPDTPITGRELEYVVNDVVGLSECIKKQLEAYGDDLRTIPMTNTGYIRREIKKRIRGIDYIKEMKPPFPLYKLLRRAFAGGYTHANRFFVGDVLENVHCVDYSSSYPYNICNCKYPNTVFYSIPQPTVKRIEEYISSGKKAIIMDATFTNVRMKNNLFGFPYFAKAKSRKVKNYIDDNGRLLSADYLETSITDLDYKIIREVYDFDEVTFSNAHWARYGMLPRKLRSYIASLYGDKTSLKGVEGKEDVYRRSKNQINSSYGMMAQDPVHDEVLYVKGEWTIDVKSLDEMIADYDDTEPMMPYAWGVWTTAWARYRLYQALLQTGNDGVYCDTDSVKYIGNKRDFTLINQEAIENSLSNGTFADDKHGTTHYMGILEDEGEYQKFRAWGSKKYCYVQNNKMKVTVAGVNKAKAVSELGCIENFAPGFVFRKSGGAEAHYNDVLQWRREKVHEHIVERTSCVSIINHQYKLDITQDYRSLLYALRIEANIEKIKKSLTLSK